MGLSKDDFINLMIITVGYHNSRYIRVDGGNYFVNKKIREAIIELGLSEKYNELNLKGSSQHKGIKKMIYHCKLNNISITGHEIKSLFRTRKRSQNSKNIIFCTYNVGFVLKALTEILDNKFLFNNYYDYLPDYYREIKNYNSNMKEISTKENKFFKNGIRIELTLDELQTQI